MPAFATVLSSLLLPASAVLAGAVDPAHLVKRAECKSTYYSQNQDTCTSIEKKYSLKSGTIHAANSYLNCNDIWSGTPICVPNGPYACSQTYTSASGDTCDSLERKFGLKSGDILAANTFLTCNNIWAGTPICVPPGGSSNNNNNNTPSSSSSSPPAASTPKPCKSTYYSAQGDTCSSLDTAYNLVSGSIKGANNYLDCNNIWSGTPICVPDGPYAEDIGCTMQTYYAQQGDTCSSIERKFALVSGDVKQDNSYVDCNNIWAGTPLVICVPPQADHGCTKTISSWDCATCDDIGSAYGVSGSQIKAWNDFVDCNDIWTYTPICVAH